MFSGQIERAQAYFDRALNLFNPDKHHGLAHLYGVDSGDREPWFHMP